LPLRGDLVLEIGIDVIQYASNRYPEGKSEREREKGGKEREWEGARKERGERERDKTTMCNTMRLRLVQNGINVA